MYWKGNIDYEEDYIVLALVEMTHPLFLGMTPPVLYTFWG